MSFLGMTRRDTGAAALGWAMSKLSLLILAAAICFLGQAVPAQAQGAAPVCPPGQDCPCAWTSWVNRDTPGATGDWEDLPTLIKEGKLKCRRPLAVQCRYRGGAVWGSQIGTYPPSPTPVGYTCMTTQGGICKNANTKPKNSCKDSEV